MKHDEVSLQQNKQVPFVGYLYGEAPLKTKVPDIYSSPRMLVGDDENDGEDAAGDAPNGYA